MVLPPADELQELRKRETERKLEADWEIDAFMTADTVAGKREAIVSEYILRILGLEVMVKPCHTLYMSRFWSNVNT